MGEYDAKLHVNIALSHFPPVLLSENSKRGPRQNFISVLDSDMAREIGLIAVDRVAGVNKFYALPNFRHASATAYLAIAEIEAISRGSNIEPTVRLCNSSKSTLRNASIAVVREEELTTSLNNDSISHLPVLKMNRLENNFLMSFGTAYQD